MLSAVSTWMSNNELLIGLPFLGVAYFFATKDSPLHAKIIGWSGFLVVAGMLIYIYPISGQSFP
jgi:hypothetical protein